MHLLVYIGIKIIIRLMCIKLEVGQRVVSVGYKFWSELGGIIELGGAVRHVKRCVIEAIYHGVIGLVIGERCEIRVVVVEVIRADVKISRRCWVD